MALQLSCSAQRTYVTPQRSHRISSTRSNTCVNAFYNSSVFRPARLQRKHCRSKPASLQVVSGLVRQVSADELEVALTERQVPTIIDFYATWCGPCVLLAKELETVAEELGPDKVQILKIDTDQNPEISTQLQIQGLPTMVFVGMDKSKPALRTEGLLPARTIREIVENELSAAAPTAAPSA